MNLTLEQAAADLYATPWMTFRRITLPLLWPGILAGLMLAFVISLDDVVITEFRQVRRSGYAPDLYARATQTRHHARNERDIDRIPALVGRYRHLVLLCQQEARLNQ